MRKTKIILIIAFLQSFSAIILAQKLTWQLLPGQMPYPVGGAKAIVIDSLIYIVGGYSESVPFNLDFIQIYNPQSNSWLKQFPKMSSRRRGFTAKRYMNGILILGGIDSLNQNAAGLEYFDPRFSQGTVVLHRDINFNRIFATAEVYENLLFLFGGNTTSSAADTVHRPFLIEYNFQSKTISYSNDAIFKGSFTYQQMSALVGEDVYLFGGVSNTISRNIYRFNIKTKNFETVDPSLISIRAGGEAVYDGTSKIYIIGGYNETQALSTVEVYAPGAPDNIISAGPQMNYPRKNPAAVSYKGSIYVFGGFDNTSGHSTGSVEKLDIVTSVEQPDNSVAKDFRLFDNYPNPFNSGTTIKFLLPERSFVTVDLYNMLGEHVANLASGEYSQGEHSVYWDGIGKDGLTSSSGIYIYCLRTGKQIFSKKMLYLK
ncbi:MAG: T9SS type A sorting domain-containing protein [Bacteroidota bacterium]|nr:T9SS type A sorting domain-containing protein [Bacteroidota bacterium]MDP4192102.1 T9SS type A sorting domain-containing protein [Bacteroidota bacterium]MDP4195228.1 T9SS type A sorting domain-containing protein [Bacteroidota bacterium]